MSKKKLLKINLRDNKIKGIICSTNNRIGLIMSDAKKIECDTKVRSNESL